MNKTRVVPEKEAREGILSGVNTIADAVETTLGPKGNNVGISRVTQQGEVYERVVLHDGVSVGRAVELEDEIENFGARVLLEAAQKSVDETGDSTTATICLSRAILVEANKRLAAGINAQDIKKEVEQDVEIALKTLDTLSSPITTLEQKIQVATISSEEPELGKLIGETIHNIGEYGVVTIDKSRTGKTYVEMQEGMQWDKGYASPYFMTDPNTRSATVENGLVLVTDYLLHKMLDLVPLIQTVLNSGERFITIIAQDFEGDVLPSFIQNKMEGKFMPLLVKAPSFGEHQRAMLQDIATLTGATYISHDIGIDVKDITPEHLGRADKIEAGQNTTILSGGKGDKEAIQARINEVQALLDEEESDFEKERLKERLAKLSSGVAVIRVGGETDIEIKERYERALDAALATRQAVKGGIVPGGETTYLRLAQDVKSKIMKDAFEAPFKRLMENADMNSGQMLERLDSCVVPMYSEKGSMGIDVNTGEIVDLIKEGIIDPTLCLKSAIKNASSVALTLLTTKRLVLPVQKDESSMEKNR